MKIIFVPVLNLIISKVGLNVRTHARTQLTRCRRRKASSPQSAVYMFHMTTWYLPCYVSRGKELTWGCRMTALAASHFSCCILYSRYQPAPKRLLQAKVITFLPLMTARTGWLDNGREIGKVFWGWGASCCCSSRDVNAFGVRCHVFI